MAKHRRYTAGFKVKVALEAIRKELTTAELLTKYAVHPTVINGWKRQAVANMAQFSAKTMRLTGSVLGAAQHINHQNPDAS